MKHFPKTKLNVITTLPDAVFFDYDGTICNNSKYLVKAFNYAVKMNFDKKKDAIILKAVKKIKKDSEKWSYIKQNCPMEVFTKCNEDYDEYISSKKLCLVRNVKKVIKLFYKYNIPMFVVSQKRGDGLREELRRSKLINYFSKAYGTLDFDELQKPSKEYIDAVLKDSKMEGKRCWMIGDRHSDVIAGLNMNGNIFIIDKNDMGKIYNENSDLIGSRIFFTSYLRLIIHIMKIYNKTKRMK